MDMILMKEELKEDEDERLFPYLDTEKKWTIGIGHNLTDNGIPQAVSDLLFMLDMREVTKALNARCPWWKNLDEVRQRVVANMVFNVGIDSFLGFARTITFIKAADFAAASREMLDSRWAKQVGKRATRLSEMMRTGEAV